MTRRHTPGEGTGAPRNPFVGLLLGLLVGLLVDRPPGPAPPVPRAVPFGVRQKISLSVLKG